MGRIRPGFVQIGPSQKTSSPVSLASFMIADKFIIVNRPICLVQGICSSCATVISQTGGHRNSGPRQEDSLILWYALAGGMEVVSTRSQEKVGQSMNGTGRSIGVSWDDYGGR